MAILASIQSNQAPKAWPDWPAPLPAPTSPPLALGDTPPEWLPWAAYRAAAAAGELHSSSVGQASGRRKALLLAIGYQGNAQRSCAQQDMQDVSGILLRWGIACKRCTKQMYVHIYMYRCMLSCRDACLLHDRIGFG